MTGTPPPAQVWPTLRARDARALIRFLVDASGFGRTVVQLTEAKTRPKRKGAPHRESCGRHP